MPIKPARERGHPHTVIDAKLQWLHSVALRPIVFLPMYWIGVISEAAHPCQGVIDVAGGIVILQGLIFRPYRSDTNLLGAPVEIGADAAGREQHERSHRGVGIVGAPPMGV